MNTESYAVLAVVVALAFVLGTLARRVRMSAAIGYLMAGLIIGAITKIPQDLVTAFGVVSEISVALLLFEIGYEIRVSKIQQLRGAPTYVTVLELLMSLALVAAAGLHLGFSTGTSLIIGVSAAFASTVFTFKLLEEVPPAREAVGNLVLMTLAAEDIAIVVTLTALSGRMSDVAGAVEVAALAMAVSLGIYWGGSLVLPRIIEVGESGLILLISYGLLSALATSIAGLSPSIGAFVAGVTASKIRRADEVMEKFRPVRAVFIFLFLIFMGIEAAATVPEIIAHPAALVIGFLIVPIHLLAKILATLVGGGLGLKYGIEASLYLSTVSELSLLISYTAVTRGLAEPFVLPAIAVGVSASSITASSLLNRKHSIVVNALRLTPRKLRWVIDAVSLSVQRQAESRIHKAAYHLFHIITHSAGEAVIATLISIEVLKHVQEVVGGGWGLATAVIAAAYVAVTARLVARAIRAADRLASVFGAPKGIRRVVEVGTAAIITGLSAETAAILIITRYGAAVSSLTGIDLSVLAPILLSMPITLALLAIAAAALVSRET